MDKNLALQHPELRATEVSVFDPDEPGAVINMISGSVQRSIVEHRNNRPDLFNITEEELLEKTDLRLSATEGRMRVSFWMEYDAATLAGRPMSLAQIYGGVVSKDVFYNNFMKRPELVAWMLCPPANYEKAACEALVLSTNKMRDILAMPAKDQKGKLNVKLLELQAKIHAMFELRVKGAVATRNVQLNLTPEGVKGAVQEETMEDIERRIKNLESQDRVNARTIAAASRPIRGRETADGDAE